MDPLNIFDSDDNYSPLCATTEDSNDSDWGQTEPAVPHPLLPDLTAYTQQVEQVETELERPRTRNARSTGGEDERQHLDDAITQCELF